MSPTSTTPSGPSGPPDPPDPPGPPGPAGRHLPDGLALRCTACGARSADPLVFACPAATPGDDVDHVLAPPEPPLEPWPAGDGEADPFVRYRTLSYPYRLHRAWGGTDARYLALVADLQRAIGAIDGAALHTTELRAVPGADLLAPWPAPDTVWVKNETSNVAGSHKARHLFGLALQLAVVADASTGPGSGVRPGPTSRPRLAISSCGNAALAAAVIAAAARYPLEVFVPPTAARSVLDRLEALGATINVCPRVPGRSGDPCYTAFLGALDDGALAFAAQGPQNGLTLEGAATLGYELADQLRAAGGAPPTSLFVQVGGGALAAAVMIGLRRAVERGALARPPALFAVQTASAAPLARAYQRVVEDLGPGTDPGAFAAALERAAGHRSGAMWAWEHEPHSVAGGILDDETYDWRAIVQAMHDTGGAPLVVSEELLVEANRRGCAATGIDADATGTAGLAGLLQQVSSGQPPPIPGDAVVIFSGARRAP